MAALFFDTALPEHGFKTSDIIHQTGLQYHIPYHTSHLGALHLLVKLPNEQCSPPVPQGTLWAAPCDTTDMIGNKPLGQQMNTQLLITVNPKP